MNIIQNTRDSLASARWREDNFLNVMAVANDNSVPLKCLPVDILTLDTIRDRSFYNSSLYLGFSPFVVTGVIPITEEARESNLIAFVDALSWASDKSEVEIISLVDEGFTKRFLTEAAESARNSPAVTAVLFGITLEQAYELARPEVDRRTIVVFSRHFALRLFFRGTSQSRLFVCRDPVQIALTNFLKQRTTRYCRPFRRRLLQVMFSKRAQVQRSVENGSTEQVLRDVRKLEELFSELQLGEAVMQRLFALFPSMQEMSNSLSRSLRRQMSGQIYPQQSSPKRVPEKEPKELLLQMIRALIVDALGSRYTTLDLIFVFCIATFVSVRALEIDAVSEHEAFWLTWAERRLSPFMRQLATSTTNAERQASSPQKIT